MADSTKTLKIFGQNQSIFFKPNQNLLEVLNANNVGINQSCGGHGICTTCRVIIHSGSSSFTSKTEIEIERSLDMSYADNERLACQMELLDSAEIEIPNSED